MNEFDLIQKFFFSRTKQGSVIVGNGDDCAIVKAPAKHSLAMSMDTLVSGLHFDDSFSPENIGYKSLAVNLSDLAAVGATPAWVMLSLSLPSIDEKWLAGFQAGFFELFDSYPMTLIGGDLTRGPLSITVQVTGFLPDSTAILRSGAQVGDYIYVTHEVGDAVLALQYLHKGKALSEAAAKNVLQRLHRPTPRIQEGILLRGIANSAIDISDGLYGDLKHILNASGVGAKIFIDQIPVSGILAQESNDLRRQIALHSGDSYELCFTAAKNAVLPKLPCKITCIGEITQDLKIKIIDDKNQPVSVVGESFTHFQ
ncbi:MAG: thiamine-phosphate kinase [Gammaproteobacteria bacterium]|nr:thiamine-phosphate kinase [Gammaproteobacteria bacterium]